jgi:DNA-binding MarR family transcriptional regulator
MQAFSEENPQEDGGAGREGSRLHLERWLPYRLFAISVRVADVLTAYYGPRYGISRAAWRTMAIVANRRGISAKEICQAGSLDQFAVSRAIAQLVEFGYAHRQTAKSDKRYAAIELTREGWAVFQDISALCKRIDEELMGQITAK